MGRPNVNWNIGVATEKHSTHTSKAIKAGIPFASQVTEPDMKYIIKYDFDLGGEVVTLPEDSILEFDGGKLANGTLVGNKTTIVNTSDSFIFDNILVMGQVQNDHFVGDWFIGNPEAASDGINAAVEASYWTDVSEVRLKRYKYSITSPIYLYNKSRLIGRSGGLRTPSNGQTYGYLTSVTYIFVRDAVDGIIITPKEAPATFNPDDDQSYAQSAKLSIDSVAIHNIFLNYNTAGTSIINSNNDIKSNYGIHVCNQYTYTETVTVDGKQSTVVRRYPIVFRNSDFQNVGVNNFKYGIYIENRLYYPSGSAEWGKVVCTNNHVGMVIQGGGKDAHWSESQKSYTNGVWCNCFHFDACIFANNYLGGVYIDNVYQAELVKFENCVMEGNGNDYNPVMLWNDEKEEIDTYHPKLDGVILGAYAFRCRGTAVSAGISNNGQIIFDNCYIEWNYFRRLGKSTDAISGVEAAYTGNGANYISPVNVMKNSYAIQSDRMPVVVTKCRLSFLIKIAYIHGARYWEKDNFIRFEVRTAPSYYPNLFAKDDYLIYYKMFSAGWYSDLTIEETFDYNKAEASTLFLYIKKFVESNRALSLVKCIENDCLPDIHIKVTNEPELNIREKDFEGELWLNKNSDVIKVTGICTYFSEGFDIYDLDRVCSLITDKNENSIFKVQLRKSKEGTYYRFMNASTPTDAHRHGFHLMPHNFPADYTTVVEGETVVTLPILRHQFGLEPKIIYNDLTIDNFYFINEGESSTTGEESMTPAINVVGGNVVEFNNCSIFFGTGHLPLITTKVDNLTIRFNNCSFTMTTYIPEKGYPYGNKPKVTDNIHNVVEYNNCTVGKGLSLINYTRSGLFVNRPAFDNDLCIGYEYFCTDRHYTIYYGGNSNWYDSTGTLVTE